MDAQRRKKIFEALKSHHGWVARMHEKTKHLKDGGFHRNHFYNVFNGIRKDHFGFVLIGADLLIELTEEKELEQKRKAERVDQALAKVDKLKEAS